MLELLKVIVRPVVLERDVDGKIIGEQLGEPQPLYTQEQVEEFFANVNEQLTIMNQDNTNG